jgi:methionyl aminopeptidase
MMTVKNQQEIAMMREGGRILAQILTRLKQEVRPGIITDYLNKLAEELVLSYGAKSSFRGYRPAGASKPYPAVLCVSMNEEIVHTPPSQRVLNEGDIITLDFGVLYKGFHTDAAITVPVGKVDSEVLRLIHVTKKALKLGIKKVHPGITIGDIGETIHRYVASQNFYVVRELVGHGIGRQLHEEPEIPNYGKRHAGPELKEGMVICIEPMVMMKDAKVIEGDDGFTFKSADNSLSAHFEHTIAITKDGHEILTEL